MEYWSNGVVEKACEAVLCVTPSLQYSNTPSLHSANFESSQQPFRQFAGLVLRLGWFIRGSIPQSADNRSKVMRMGANPTNGSRQRGRRSNAQPGCSFARTPSASPAADRWLPAAGSY